MKKKIIKGLNTTHSETDKDIRDLVLARIMASSDDLRVAIGSTEYTKNEIIDNVKAGNKIGKEIIEIQMEYLRDLASGAIYKATNV